LALEPEAASIWCQQVDVGKQHVFNKTGCKYLVADLGGACFTVGVDVVSECKNANIFF